jgi:hypothetical protein
VTVFCIFGAELIDFCILCFQKTCQLSEIRLKAKPMFNNFLGFTSFSARRIFALRLAKDRGFASTRLHVGAANSRGDYSLA